VRLLSAAVPQVKNYGKNILPSGYARGPTIFWLPPISREEEIKIVHVLKFVCPTTQELLKRPAGSAFKRLILTTPLRQHLLLTMSSIPTSVELNDSECEKGHVTQRPPIPYAVSKAGLVMMTTRGIVKIKTTEGVRYPLLCNGFRYLEPLSNYKGIWNSHVESLPLHISGT
jgi:hypothetical protein